MTGPVRSAAPMPRLAAPRLAALWLAAAACWTDARSAPAGPPTSFGAPPPACPARLVAVIRDAQTEAPIAGATVVVETARGRVAALVTDARGRIDTAAVGTPARLRVYHGEHAVEHQLVPCQPPLRLDVRRAP